MTATSADQNKKRVAVIGCGVSGLVTIKSCLEVGLSPVCFEIRNSLGGLWNYSDHSVPGRSSVTAYTITNTSKEAMCFSDFPFPKEFPLYFSHRKALQYLNMYADHFDLRKYIHFKSKVVQVKKSADDSWLLTVQNIVTDSTKDETFDAVIVCCGLYSHQFVPNIRGLDTFPGKVVHTQDLRTHKGFEGKRVVVVGFASSAGDAADEISCVTQPVYLSSRSHGWLYGRTAEGCIPIDMKNNSRFLNVLRQILPASFTHRIFTNKLNAFIHHPTFVKPNCRPLQGSFVISDTLPMKIVTNDVIIKPGVREIKDGNVIFTDDSTVTDVDVLVFGTGYELRKPDFLRDFDIELQRLYKRILPPNIWEFSKSPSLAFVGYCNAFGPVYPIFEMQARYIAQVLKGNISVPEKDGLLLEIDRSLQIAKSTMLDSKGYYIRKDVFLYIDGLSVDVGCKPNIGQMLFKDPALAFQCFFGPCTPCQYRLEGPNRWEGAREAIMTTWQRALFPYRHSVVSDDDKENNGAHHKVFLPVAFMSIVLMSVACGLYNYISNLD